MTLIVTNDSQPANGRDEITLTVIARDANNVPVSNVTVNFVSDSDTAFLEALTGTTEENGRFTTTVTNSLVETVEVRATAGGIPAQPVTLTFIDSSIDTRVSTVTMIVTNDSQPANGRDEITLTVIARDANNVPVSDVAVNLVSTSNFALFNPLNGTTSQNGRFTTTVTNSLVETVEVRATAGGIPAQPVTLTFVNSTIDPRVSTAKVITSNDFQQADGLAAITLTVIARDANHVPVSDVAVNLVSDSDTAFFDALTGTTEENGRFTTTVTNSVAETVEVKVTAGGVPAQTVTLTFIDSSIDPRVSTVTLIVTNDSQPANGRDEITLTVIVRDAKNTPLSNVPVNLESTSDFALFQALSGTTTQNGRFTTTVTSTVAETFEVTATAGGVQDTPINVTFAAPVGEVVLRASSEVLSVNDTSTITVTILRKVELEEVLETFSKFFDNVSLSGDTLDNLLQQDILLPQTPFTAIVSGNAVLHNVEKTTNENGQASFTVTNTSKETTVITVTAGPVTRTLQLFFGASLNLLPKSVNAISTATLTALLKDGNQAPIVEQAVKFQFIGDNNETLTPNTATTGADGTAEVTITDLENNGGTAKVNVNSGTLGSTATVKFLAAFGENRRLLVTTTDTVLNVNQSATITARIIDNNDFPIGGQPVEFAVALADGRDSQARVALSTNSSQREVKVTGISDSQGEVKAIVSETIGENVVVTVKADTAKQEIPLYFGASLRLSPTDAHGIADGTTPVTLTATVNDTQGVGIAGIPVNFRVVASGRAFLSNFRPSTDELGRAIVTVTSDTVDDNTQIEAQADSLPIVLATFAFQPSEPSSLRLSTSANSLSFNSADVPITAVVKDAQGNPVKDGTHVNFTTTLGIITELVPTNNKGSAEAQFTPNMQAGLATITATAGSATDSITLTVQPGSAGTIEVSKIEPNVIGISGSGVVQSATLEFLVKDNLGNPVADGTSVDFALGKTTLGGGETITTQGQSGITASGTTNNGLVSVTLKSGAVAGNIDVIATVNNTISTVARVTIVGGVPDADHLSLAVEFHNIAGGVTFGLLDTITAFVGDRFGNIVPDGTSVSFITEGGTIGKSIGGGAFTTTTEFGQATAILQSASPTVPLLGGVATLRNLGYQCSGDYAEVDSPTPELLCGNPGLVTIVAFTTGSESLVDKNGNGLYDAGEPFKDLSEPYIDGNDNNAFDEGELYIDVNGNGQFDNGNNLFDGPGGASQNTTIWYSGRVLFSAITAPLLVNWDGTDPFSIPNGSGQTFTVENIADEYGNALVTGTRFQVTTNNGILGGTTDLTFGDNSGRGMPLVTFTLSSNPPERITEKDKDGNEHTRLEYPPPASATITITITSPFLDKPPGGNGDEELVFSGTINAR
ncbi:MAG: hypothetical protein DRR19_09415 [Candidatus Parabeggiatoa sp. nov. 1]|nr:MAG: hypothetical protein DRR19_09415 [Gammaproteobacteria bacterium]